MKTWQKILIAVGLAGGAFVATKMAKAANTNKIGWQDKMRIDAYNPSTQFGADIKRYHDNTGTPYNPDDALRYHLTSNPATREVSVYASKSEWGENEVVTY